MTGSDECARLAADLGRASRQIASALFDVYKEEGDKFADDWRLNARATSGTHGKYYPDSIDADVRIRLGIEIEVGPNGSKKQGKMGRGFELGSQNQPPHLDGLRALPAADARLARAAERAVNDVMP